MWWVQCIGLAALLLDIGSVQLKLRRHILITQIIASLTWAAHFILLGAIAGSMMNLVGAIRSVSYYEWRGTQRPVAVLYFIMALSVIVTIATWQGSASLLPMAAMIIAANAFWQRNEQMIRVLLILAAPLWLAYNVIFHSYAGILSDTIAVISLSVALYRYRLQGFSKPAEASL